MCQRIASLPADLGSGTMESGVFTVIIQTKAMRQVMEPIETQVMYKSGRGRFQCLHVGTYVHIS